MKKLLFLAILLFVFLANASIAEEHVTVYVTAKELNGRFGAGKNFPVETLFVKDDALTAVSYKDGWVEVVGGEPGTVWCKAEYLSETTNGLRYKNTSGGRVRVCSELGIKNKTNVKWIKANKIINVSSVLFGWGYVGYGWVDLSYFSEEIL